MNIKKEDNTSAPDKDIDTLPVSKFMTKTVITANLDQTIQSACKIMNENNLGGIVIVKRGVSGN